MIKAVVSSNLSKSKGQVVLEYVLLALCLCIIALRTTFTQGPTTQSTGLLGDLSDIVRSLSMSTILILSFVIWFVWSFCSKRFLYRFSGIEIGLCIFIIAGIVAGFAAADKRAAITSFVTLLSLILMAILLVQILDTQSKIKLLLCGIAALGVVSAYRCTEQFSENEQLIKFYEDNRDEVLAKQNVTQNTLEHFQFKHRLYSRDIRGFFTTSNSAGSFALLASFAVIALLIDKFKNRKYDPSGSVWLVTCGIAASAVILGLAVTRSKGAIAGSLMAAVMFIAYLLFGLWLKAHRKAVFIVSVLLVIAGAGMVIWYGSTHDRLPGGNSMLVRWQYWHASAKMYADYPITGVGPGNFPHFYLHYKPAAALESVSDPHNFLLTILTQYGPLGLVGFLVMILVPLWRASGNHTLPSPKAQEREPAFKKLAIPFLIVVSAALLLIRPVLSPMQAAGSLIEWIAAVIILYVMPVVIFIVGFLLVAAPLHERRRTKGERRAWSVTSAALFCAVLGVLIHNLIDFAIFEPGVFATFWAIIACLIAIRQEAEQKSRTQSVLKPAPAVKMLIAAGVLILVGAYFNYAFIPAAKVAAKIKPATSAIKNAQQLLDKAAKGKPVDPAKIELAIWDIEYAHPLLDKAAKDDRLDPTASNLNGRSYLLQYDLMGQRQPALLRKAAQCFRQAIKRNEASYNNYEKLSGVYTLLGEHRQAYELAVEAAARYPGSGRLQFRLAEIAEQLGKTDIAIKHYKKAVDIEDKYRRQFQEMYPAEEIVSRLGEEKYQLAKEQIKHLSQQPIP